MPQTFTRQTTSNAAVDYLSCRKMIRLKGDNKDFYTVEGATHCDLYDGGGKGAVPFDKLEKFFKDNLH